MIAENGARFNAQTNTGAYWSEKLYKALPLNHTTDPDATTACTFMCYYDDDMCSIAIWEGNTCYLGHWNIKASFFTTFKTSAMTRTGREQFYIEKFHSHSSLFVFNVLAIAGLIHGGTNSADTVRYDSFDHIIMENQQQCNKQNFLPSGGEQRYVHGMVYVEPWLMVCGGYKASNSRYCKMTTTITESNSQV